MKMLADSDLMYPKQWLGGGKSSGESQKTKKKFLPFLVMQWLRSEKGRKVQMVDRQIIKSSCTKYKKIFGADVSHIKFEED